jgi:hypothetical protein
MLTELFGLLNKLITVLTPVFKGIISIIKAVKGAAEAIWKLKEAIAALGLVFLLTKVSAIAAGLQVVISAIRILGPLLVGAAASAASLYVALAGFIYVFSSIDDYMNGEENWVYGLQLMLEIAMARLDQFQLRVQIWWKQMKAMWDSFQLDPAKFVKDNAFNLWYKNQDPLTRWAIDKMRSINENGITFEGSARDLYPSQPKIQQPKFLPNMMQGSPLIINIDASKVSGAQNDPEKFGKAVGGEVSSELQRIMGGLGIYGR